MTRPQAAVPATSRSASTRAPYLAALTVVVAGCAPHATVSAQAAGISSWK